MKAYLDSVTLIEFLYEFAEKIEIHPSFQLFEAIRRRKLECLVSFYAFPELFGYVQRNYPPDISNTVFRESLVVLFSYPITIVPYLGRAEVNRLRRHFTIADPYDALHAACALFHGCDTIVTYDSHFDAVAEKFIIATPQEILQQLQTNIED